MPPFREVMSVAPALKNLLLEISAQSDLQSVLSVVVSRLAELDDVALARIWMIRPGDICDRCPMRNECPNQSRCLHLVASEGTSRLADSPDWSRLDGDFSRFPLGVRKVGRCADDPEGVSVRDIDADPKWIARPEWAQREGIRGFAAKSLVFQDEVLGVLAIFTRATLGEGCLEWLRMIADLVAASIANARANDEIRRLRQQLEVENEYLREEVSDARAFGDILGGSAALKTIVQQIDLVAKTDANVLILGESGVGKELVAQEIHRRSERNARALVRVNCASVPRELYESEFFGHVKGAFTGAVRDRVGRFETASGGTLFLDEVGEIPLDLQSKLLRVLQEGTYERVGDDRTRETDVRVVAATNRDLREEVAAGRFREDLYFRLAVFPVEVPPLRNRREDIPLLASAFLQRAVRRFNRGDIRLTEGNLLALQRYDWPGNVRELINVVERAVITSTGRTLQFDLESGKKPRNSRSPSQVNETRESVKANAPMEQNVAQVSDRRVFTHEEIRELEIENIRAALERCNWKVHGPHGAAELLKVRPTTLASKIKKLGLVRK